MPPTYASYSLGDDPPARWRVQPSEWLGLYWIVSVALEEQHGGEWRTDPEIGWYGTAADARELAARLIEAADAIS